MSTPRTTTDHDEIRAWVEARDGAPARVPAAEAQGGGGVLRLDFTGGASSEDIEHIPWDEWLDLFDDQGLAFTHKDIDVPGEESTYFDFTPRHD
ncbi:hypothetical protein G4H71_08740 [Rhodococcus triatomae]|uniref:1,4-alpha-glucan branching enzyme n=1 Tax=Rhodococcus triatomae TaxID=300028 RepID=A0A1G8I7A9_9NOCA|nr:hypothetical protein [Rhodococcus triatomae]QNG20978.1 hypothetical protein G4H72_21645 [Rhodococcus triatomae]QNG23107.1 hypothetical protein G4H71_08740 [Rhodococcus triatomae]SDI14855.1 hypothetical protein SAMN05444695_105185 [Rhodococcus triatomae]